MSRYLRYEIENLEPIRIADDSRSQTGEMISLRYIPGSTIRGLVVNNLAKNGKLDSVKKVLFSEKTRFLNAYIKENGHELIPSPKGFYEDKTISEKKKIENVVINGDFSEGMKRASLGRFCYIENDCIYYYGVKTDSDLKIKINLKNGEKQNVFRNEYIASGYTFVGYIAIDDNIVESLIKDTFGKEIIIGNARSSGLGKCKVVKCELTDQTPYAEYSSKGSITNECYMMLLSNTTMRNEYGEYCGIDKDILGEYLGVKLNDIKLCSTSTVDIMGFNRTWNSKIPAVTMYEMGSVFHLTFDGTITEDKLNSIQNVGIGIRKNEGFGRVLILKDYEKICYKKEDQFEVKNTEINDIISDEDKNVIRLAARNEYKKKIQKAMQEKILSSDRVNWKGTLPGSQLGTVDSLIASTKYDPKEAEKSIKLFFDYALEKEDANKVHKQRNSIRSFRDFVLGVFKEDINNILDLDVQTIMGIPSKELLSQDDTVKIKLEYVSGLIRFDNRRREGR